MPVVSAASALMLVLVAFIAVVIHAYSARYLDGQPAQAHYRRWFFATIAATLVLVATSDLRVLALAWTASSLSLHQLLNFFAERPQSQVAAHKKFLLSRLADLCIYAAVFLLGRTLGTYNLDALGAQAASLATMPTAVTAAGYLLVAGIVMRSAQLPFHGWLIQVMEAPTPVSALLHAGVVNIGGYVLIRLASLIGVLPGAQAVLVVMGTITAVVAGVVMLTRVSIKVSLAWSTCAQMGFMLLECGLGLWELALLHLIAHSLYKAWAFLSSGSVVRFTVARRLAPVAVTDTWGRWLGAAVASGVIATGVALIAWPGDASSLAAIVPMTLLAMALTPTLAGVTLAHGGRAVAMRLVTIAGVAALYVVWHAAFQFVAPADAAALSMPALAAFTLTAFALLTLLQATIAVHPRGAVAQRLYPLAYAGFHLDDLFTRATFLLWPPRHRRQAAPSPQTPAPMVLERAA